ncbi:hypothetical protein HMPREF9370_0885 [Neisseria wadsworthii 9715]|uniref:Uncharacterized protein n=1 Tax=Neisseria wadsworthii 9715 TaxID=1030841 RepID=G4CP76_9NEIS|nr:hypothetical protein HMPREF9370_0885 [Neisseria wadsworthii 9715]
MLINYSENDRYNIHACLKKVFQTGMIKPVAPINRHKKALLFKQRFLPSTIICRLLLQ